MQSNLMYRRRNPWEEEVPPRLSDGFSIPEAPPRLSETEEMPEAPPSISPEGPPELGRDPMFRRGLIAAREQTDAPPPLSRPRFGEGPISQEYQQAALDYAKRAGEKTPLWRNLVGGTMAAFRPTRPLAGRVLHPGLEQAEERMKGLKGAADEERLQQQAQSNEDIKRANQEALTASRQAADDARQQAAEDRRIKLLTDPNLEEASPTGAYRGTVDVGGKKLGILPPEVVAGRRKTAEKEAELASWMDVPQVLQQKYGLQPKAPHQTIDNVIRIMEAEGRAQEAAALRREIADKDAQLRRDLANQADATRRDLSAASNQTRREISENARENKPPTAAQSTVATYAARLKKSNEILEKISQSFGERSWNKAMPDWASFLRTDAGQSFDQAERDFINATLRRESGAVINPDEFRNARQQYIDQPGDSPDVRAQKRNNRLIIQESFKRAAGKAYEDPDELLRSAGVNPGGPQLGETKEYQGHTYKFDGKQWVKQ